MQDNDVVVNEMQSEVVADAPKAYTQTQINDMIKHAKAVSAERTRKELSEQHEAQLAQMQRYQAPQGNTGTDAETVAQMVLERLKEEQQRMYANQVSQQFGAKLAAGKTIADDFDEVLSELDLSKHADVILMANELDNSAEIMYELSKNKGRLNTVEGMLDRGDRKAALAEVRKLSKSIKDENTAKETAKHTQTNEPLSRQKPSAITSLDNGKLTYDDLRNADWLRA